MMPLLCGFTSPITLTASQIKDVKRRFSAVVVECRRIFWTKVVVERVGIVVAERQRKMVEYT